MCIFFYYTSRNEVVGGYAGFTMSVRLSVRLETNPMSYDNLSCVSENLLKFDQLFTGEERRILSFLPIFTFALPELMDLI